MRGHEAGLIPYADALARHKAIAVESHAVAIQMRALVSEKRGPKNFT